MVRALLRGERDANAAQLLGLVALIIVLSVTTYLSVTATSRFRHFQRVVIGRCLNRQVYDASIQDALRAQIDWLRGNVDEERTNKFIDDRLRMQRIDADQTAMAKFQAALDAAVKGSCSVYR